jgi:hypothetical protein
VNVAPDWQFFASSSISNKSLINNTKTSAHFSFAPTEVSTDVFTLAEFIMITPATATSGTHHCTFLGHLGCATQIELFLFLVVSPKVAKARTYSVTLLSMSVAVTDVFAKIALQL